MAYTDLIRRRLENVVWPDHLSAFNLYFETNRGKHIVLNTLSRSLVAFSSKNLCDPESKNLVRNLREAWAIVEEPMVDRLRYYQIVVRQKDERGLFLQILTTTQCNMNCAYCYEQRYPTENLDHHTAQSVATLVEHCIREYSVDTVNIEWFGGEPLLNTTAMVILTDSLNPILHRANVDYSASIVTNGLLLDAVHLRLLQSLKVRQAMISLDGLPDSLDARAQDGSQRHRMALRVLKNIESVPRTINVILRLNIKRDNINALLNLVRYIGERGLQSRVTLRFNPILPLGNAARPSVYENTLSGPAFRDAMIMILRHMKDWRCRLVGIPSSSRCTCIGTLRRSLIVEPSGNLRKCYINIGNPRSGVIGNINELSSEEVVRRMENDKLVNYSPEKIPECGVCTYLPICGGFCPEMRSKYKTYDLCYVKYYFQALFSSGYIEDETT